jgi:MoaA/NifB/PqqE/SkfB family radical SAM enzyme
MCDIWLDNANQRELSPHAVARWTVLLRRLRTRWVVLSGGEPLMHSDLPGLIEILRQVPVRISLLSTGLLLERYSAQVAELMDDVIVSLDGSQPVHDAIRRVPKAYERLARGIAAVRSVRPSLRITARCVVQKANYADLLNIPSAAHELGLDQISFLAVDVSSTAFNRPDGWPPQRLSQVALDAQDLPAFRDIIERLITTRQADLRSGFVAEDASKLRRMVDYFAALLGQAAFPANRCNAPWLSAVIEADGTVRPCFFHPALGNAVEKPLHEVLNSRGAIQFRRQLDVRSDPVCRRCTCSLHLPLSAAL